MFANLADGVAQIGRTLLIASALAGAVVAPATAHEFKAGELQIKHPWSRATVPAAKVGGGYFTVVNPTDAPDRLISATVEVAQKVEIHQMDMKDGVMTMRAVDGGLDVPAKGELALQPGKEGGGYHLMFMGLKKPLVEGEKIPGTLTFEKAGTVSVEFAVEGKCEAAQDHSSH
ncbi:MAG: copper chaperone PCu(A)C [Rhizobiaceae bacterium]